MYSILNITDSIVWNMYSCARTILDQTEAELNDYEIGPRWDISRRSFNETASW